MFGVAMLTVVIGTTVMGIGAIALFFAVIAAVWKGRARARKDAQVSTSRLSGREDIKVMRNLP